MEVENIIPILVDSVNIEEVDLAFKEGKWMTIDDDGRVKVIKEQEKEINDYCYFCDFNELKPHKHHIIRKSDGGKNTSSNLLSLCPNHHELIHKKYYFLYFYKGFYFLINRKNYSVITPSNRQKNNIKKLPLGSINRNDNLLISKEEQIIKVNVKDLYKAQRFKNIKKGVKI